MIARPTHYMTAVVVLATAAGTIAAQDFDDVQIESKKVADGIYMLTGAGGNLGLSAGADGVFLIDDQFAPLTEKIKQAASEIDARPIRFVLNTHWHGDHTGGNENMGKNGAVIVAHENVRRRMSAAHFSPVFERTTPAAPAKALPVVTYEDAVTFHLNGEEIHAFHVPPAHTDGDSIVHFRRANVLHAGDLYFNGMYPFIDTSSGGSVGGVLAAIDRLVGLADAETRIIPGHGPLSNRRELVVYRDMLKTIRDRIAPLVAAGKTLEEVQQAKPTREFDEAWGQGFIKPEQFVGLVYESLTTGG